MEIPVIVAAAQLTQARDAAAPEDPLSLMEKVAREALAEPGAKGFSSQVDVLHCVNILSWQYGDAPGELAKRLGISPHEALYHTLGGNTPQLLLNRAAQAVARGSARAVLIAGAESGAAVRRLQKGQVNLSWPAPAPPGKEEGKGLEGMSLTELSYEFFVPPFAYAFFENALRYALGRSLSGHREAMGKICSRLSAVAARNPYAWSRTAYTPEEIFEPGPGNRMVVYPYTIRMNANIYVDQAAAVVVTSERVAKELGIDPDLWVYPLSGAHLNNIWYASNRPTLHDSPALREAGRLALSRAGIGVSEVGVFDFYSCFPWAVEAARQELGVPEDDPRDLTVTGGLAYFGGPGNDYVLHSIAETVSRIRRQKELIGLVTALGWFNTKWAVGIYGKNPAGYDWSFSEEPAIQKALDSEGLPDPVAQADGRLTLESYVISHGPDGMPDRASAVGRLADGRRAWAAVDADSAALAQMEQTELVGRTGHVRFDAGTGRNLVLL
ncbi:MAG: acetyl-CoA acetyltransferase [Thermodesulfobacteriota bacterium]